MSHSWTVAQIKAHPILTRLIENKREREKCQRGSPERLALQKSSSELLASMPSLTSEEFQKVLIAAHESIKLR